MDIFSRVKRAAHVLLKPDDLQYPRENYPPLEAQHLAGAKLYCDRNEMLLALALPPGGTIAEIGVARGDFSEFILQMLAPAKFVAFDTFEMDGWKDIWGVPKSVAFDGRTHREFYKQRFCSRGSQVAIEVGMSQAMLPRYPDKTFDLIYIDADHTYEAVKADAALCKAKIKDDGVLVFNDYIMFDHLSRAPYGVVQAVNELVVSEDWRVIGFALNPNLFCDIAIRRRSS